MTEVVNARSIWWMNGGTLPSRKNCAGLNPGKSASKRWLHKRRGVVLAQPLQKLLVLGSLFPTLICACTENSPAIAEALDDGCLTILFGVQAPSRVCSLLLGRKQPAFRTQHGAHSHTRTDSGVGILIAASRPRPGVSPRLQLQSQKNLQLPNSTMTSQSAAIQL